MAIKNKVKLFVNRVRHLYNIYHTKNIVKQLKDILKLHKDRMPVIVVSYNNGVYVKNMVNQLKKYDIKPIIIDNNSTDEETRSILKELERDAYVIYSHKNFGHLVGVLTPVQDVLPKYFAYTDPDLELNKNLPKNFLDVLKELTDKYEVYKAGFALELLDEPIVDAFMDDKFTGIPQMQIKKVKLINWVKRHWRFKLEHPSLEIYRAPVDTTFAVYNKDNFLDDFYDGIRVSGDFGAVHLPWYPHRELMSKKQREIYLQNNNSSTLRI